MFAKSTKIGEIKRSWHLLDAKDKILGRLATESATLLMGKKKTYFVPHLDCGDYVVIINAGKVGVTGGKAGGKTYFRHSGYPGGLKSERFSDLLKRDPESLVRRAVWGMVPHGKLGRQIIKKLHVFAGSQHPYQGKIEGASTDNG